MNFNINLATKVYVDFKKVNICVGLFASMLIIWIALSIYTLMVTVDKSNKFSEYKSRLNRSQGTKQISDSEYTTFLSKVKSVNSILSRRSFDWLALLDNLEQLVPAGVALKSFEPAERGSLIKLSGSATNFTQIQHFVENLQGSNIFTDIYLNDQSPSREGGRKMINFTITCKASAS